MIDTPGKYNMMNGDTATIFRVDSSTCVGNLTGSTEPLVWSKEGDAVGHDPAHRIVSKHVNTPAIALQIIRQLQPLTDEQRESVLSIVSQQICIDCGSMIDPGRACTCWNCK